MNLYDYIRRLKTQQFIERFLYLWDPETQQPEPFCLWPKQRDACRTLDEGKIIFWAKARQVGGSEMAASYALKVAIQEPNSEIIILSKNEDKAKYFWKKRVLPLIQFLPGNGHTPGIDGFQFPSYEPRATGCTLENGSTIDVYTTQDDSARGNTSRLIIMDEAGTMMHAQEIWKAVLPAIEQHPYGQILVISNSKSGSWFNSMLKKIDEGRTLGITLHFLSCWTDPKRDEKWKKQRMTNFDNEVDFYVEYPETVKHMFLKREGHVYPTFNSQEGGKHVYDEHPDFSQRLIYGYDHGFDHFAVFLMAVYDPYKDFLYIFDEMYCSQKDTYEVSGLITRKIAFWQEKGMPQVAWKRIADSSIFAQRGQMTVADLLRTYTGLTFTKSIKHDEEGSMNLLRARFTTNKIGIHPRCTELIRQLRDLMYTGAGRPSDKDNDGPDVVKYWCADLRLEQKPLPQTQRKPYSGSGRNFDYYGDDFQSQSFESKAIAWMGF